MKGKHHLIVQNNRLRYELDIRRNITIIKGDSATGKTTLMDMLSQAMDLGDSSGISVSCDKEVVVVSGRRWESTLREISDAIIFIDEENQWIKSEAFAACVRDSDNYYVIITREDLPNLPYAVDEIYGIHTSGYYHDTRRIYNETYHIYSAEQNAPKRMPEQFIVEDSNAGFHFFEKVCEEHNIACESAGGKSNIRECLARHQGRETVVIADGAAYGPEMQETYLLMKRFPTIKCFLPESFEWLILKSGLIDGNEVRQRLEAPEDYIDSREFFSWERYFTKLLMEQTVGTYLQYSKTVLNPVYLQEKEKASILKEMKPLFMETPSVK